MFGLKRSNELANFAIELANEFSTRFPAGSSSEGASAKSFAKVVDEVCARAAAFRREKKLGFLGRAQFGTEFKVRLKELGYPEALVDELTRTMLMRMSA